MVSMHLDFSESGTGNHPAWTQVQKVPSEQEHDHQLSGAFFMGSSAIWVGPENKEHDSVIHYD